MTETGWLQQGAQLIDQGRYDLAIEPLRRQVAETPDEPTALALLALALLETGDRAGARRAAEDAIANDADAIMGHYALARVMLDAGDPDAAAAAAQEIVRLAPHEARGHAMLASIRHTERRYREALEAADRALAADPEHRMALNIRGLALTQLGRRDEASESFGQLLRRDPENSYAIASQALAELHAGRMRPALEGFREALRLDPTNEMARAGLVEALKARNPLYALLLRYALWSSRLSGRATLFLFLGFFLLTRVVRTLARDPQLSAVGFVLLGVYLLFVWTTYAGDALFNLLLRLDPIGRHALDDEQRAEANVVGALVAIGLPAALAAIVTQLPAAIYLAIATLGAVVPVSLAFAVEGWWRGALAVVAGAVLVLGAAAAFLVATDPQQTDAPAVLTLAAFALVVVSSWASVPIALRRRPR